MHFPVLHHLATGDGEPEGFDEVREFIEEAGRLLAFAGLGVVCDEENRAGSGRLFWRNGH
jgi:hypothetical protein